MSRFTIGLFLMACVTLLLPGCKLAVISVEGGEVQSFGHGTCAQGTICVVEIPSTSFSETFEAVPDEGWYFHNWNSGDRFLCADNTIPTCWLSFEHVEDSEAIRDVVDSPEVYYLMPIFKDYPRATRLERTPQQIVVDGKRWEWLEPVRFAGYSYNEIKATCPKGVCSGTLPGSNVDLTGYSWASSKEVGLLFQAYKASGISLLADFRPTGDFEAVGKISPEIMAILSDPPRVVRPFASNPDYTETSIYMSWIIGDSYNIVDLPALADVGSAEIGAWFWRQPD